MNNPPDVFRSVPRTGVIFVMTEAGDRGFSYGHPDWANLGQGAPETGPLPGAPERIHHIDLDDAMHEYAPVPGLLELREAVAALYNARYRRGMKSQYTAENVAISAGGRTGLTRVAASLGSINLGHLLPDYTAYEELLEVFRLFVPLPLVLHEEDGFRMAPERFERTIVGAGLSALLMSNPCNPTGNSIANGELADWVAIARRLDCWLILDEFYSHYIYDREPGCAVSAAEYVEDVDKDPVVVIDGLTKNWRYPGWRLSWTVAPKHVIERVSSAGSFLDGGPPHPLQRAVLPLLEPDVARAEAAAIQRRFGAKRDAMLTALAQLGMTPRSQTGGAFYCWAPLDQLPEPLQDGMTFFRHALERQVITVPGEFFDVDPGKRRSHIPSRLKSYVRLSFGPDMDTVQEGMRRIGEMIAEVG